MTRNNYELKTYLSKDIYDRIVKEATIQGTTMSKVIRYGMVEYFALRDELININHAPGELSDKNHGGFIHTLLARTEERLSLTIIELKNEFSVLYEQQRLLTSILEKIHLNLNLT